MVSIPRREPQVQLQAQGPQQTTDSVGRAIAGGVDKLASALGSIAAKQRAQDDDKQRANVNKALAQYKLELARSGMIAQRDGDSNSFGAMRTAGRETAYQMSTEGLGPKELEAFNEATLGLNTNYEIDTLDYEQTLVESEQKTELYNMGEEAITRVAQGELSFEQAREILGHTVEGFKPMNKTLLKEWEDSLRDDLLMADANYGVSNAVFAEKTLEKADSGFYNSLGADQVNRIKDSANKTIAARDDLILGNIKNKASAQKTGMGEDWSVDIFEQNMAAAGEIKDIHKRRDAFEAIQQSFLHKTLNDRLSQLSSAELEQALVDPDFVTVDLKSAFGEMTLISDADVRAAVEQSVAKHQEQGSGQNAREYHLRFNPSLKNAYTMFESMRAEFAANGVPPDQRGAQYDEMGANVTMQLQEAQRRRGVPTSSANVLPDMAVDLFTNAMESPAVGPDEVLQTIDNVVNFNGASEVARKAAIYDLLNNGSKSAVQGSIIFDLMQAQGVAGRQMARELVSAMKYKFDGEDDNKESVIEDAKAALDTYFKSMPGDVYGTYQSTMPDMVYRVWRMRGGEGSIEDVAAEYTSHISIVENTRTQIPVGRVDRQQIETKLNKYGPQFINALKDHMGVSADELAELKQSAGSSGLYLYTLPDLSGVYVADASGTVINWKGSNEIMSFAWDDVTSAIKGMPAKPEIVNGRPIYRTIDSSYIESLAAGVP